MSPLRGIVRIYITFVLLLGGLAAAQGLPQFDWRNTSRFFLYLGMAMVSSVFKVRLPGVTGTMSVYFVFVLMSVTQLSLGETVVISICATVMQCFWQARRRPRLVQIGFNVSCMAVAASAAHFLYHAPLLRAWQLESAIRMGMAAVAFFFLNTGLVATVIGLDEKKSIWATWRGSYFWCFPYYLLGASIADLFSAVSGWLGWQTSLMVVPVVYLVYRTYHLYVGRLETEKDHAEQMASLHMRTIEALALAIDAKDQTTHEHLQRVQVYALEMAKVMKLSRNETEALQAASVLHDIGKLAVPEHIISKPGKLTPAEFEKMKIHPVVGAEILERVQFPYPVAPVVAAHHEKWDGSGYPNGLRGDEIPIGARILSVVDCLDALASDRQYRRAMPLDAAMEKVRSMSGTAFDPRLVDVLEANYRNWEKMARSGPRMTELAKLSTDIKVERGAAPDAGFEESAEPALALGPAAAAAQALDEQSAIAAALEVAQTIFELTQELGLTLTPSEVLSMLAFRLRDIVRYDGMAIYLLRNQALVPEFVTGEDSALFSSLKIPFGQGLSGWVAENRRPVMNGNPSVEPGYLNDPTRFSKLHSAMGVPLESGDGVMGVITLYRSDRDAFSRAELRVLMAVRSKLSMTLTSALRTDSVERANVDSLTGLPGIGPLFRYLEGQLVWARAASSEVSLLVCDLDGLRQINDSQGRRAGDEWISGVAERLRESCGSSGFAARLGGDEFAIVCPGESEAATLAQLGEIQGLSIGCVRFPGDGADAETLLAEADRRMRRNKRERAGGPESLAALASQVGDLTPRRSGASAAQSQRRV